MALSDHPWISTLFGDVPDAVAGEVAAGVEPVRLARGEQLFQVGDEADALFAVKSGKIKLSRRYADAEPRRESLLTVLGEGHVFGELSVIDPGPRTTTATALANCELERLSRDHLMACLHRHPELAVGLSRQLAGRLRHATNYASDLVLNDVQGRAARVMLHLTERFGEPSPDGVVVTHGLTQAEIAQMVGASRESVNKFLMELTEAGALELSYRKFVVVDRAALEARAEHHGADHQPTQHHPTEPR